MVNEPNHDSRVRMEGYDALPANVRKAIRESLHDMWDTWSGVRLIRQGVASSALVRMVRDQEIAQHKSAVDRGDVADVPANDFILRRIKR